MIDKLTPENFIVNFKSSGTSLYFTPLIVNEGYLYNDLYCKIEIDNISDIGVKLVAGDIAVNTASKFLDFNKIPVGSTYHITNHAIIGKTVNFRICFEVRNRNTGNVMLTKTYDCSLYSISSPTVNGGVINEGKDDEEIITPDNDNNIISGFEGINSNSSLDDILGAASGSFETFKSAFAILPGFIWSFISLTLIVLLILRVLGR